MIGLVLLAIKIFYWGLIIYCVLSFVQIPSARDVYFALGKVYRPVLEPISKLLEPVQKSLGGLDFSPIVLIFILNIISNNLSRM